MIVNEKDWSSLLGGAVEVTELVQWKRGIKIRAIENGPCNFFNKLSSAFKDRRKLVSW
jgi:hypothetical protein